MSPQDALARVVELLVEPTTENLDRSIPYLEFTAEALRTIQSSSAPLPAGQAQQIRLLVRQVHALHQQAGKIRLGAARLGVGESAGYTCVGQPDAPARRPNLAITG
jgi:hypothetical protein